MAHQSGIVVGQRQVDEKSNEITAVPERLKRLFIKGCVMSVDALNRQKEIATTIVQAGGDYVMALKANHPPLDQDGVDWFEWAKERHFRDIDYTPVGQRPRQGPWAARNSSGLGPVRPARLSSLS